MSNDTDRINRAVKLGILPSDTSSQVSEISGTRLRRSRRGQVILTNGTI